MIPELKIPKAVIWVMSVCIGVTLLPILLRVVFGMILLGLQNQSLLLPPAVIREMMFVLLADFSIVAGGMLILIVYPILNKKIEIRLPATAIIVLLMISTTIGLLFDYHYCYSQWGGTNSPFIESYNFSIATPAYLLLLIFVIHLLRIKNKTIVTATAMVGSVLFMGLTFWLYAEKLGSQPTEFYGLVYVAGFAPALIIGLIYGLVVSILLDRRRASERSLQVINPRREGR